MTPSQTRFFKLNLQYIDHTDEPGLMLVQATDIEHARQLASKHPENPTVPYSRWLDPKQSSCVELKLDGNCGVELVGRACVA